MDGGHDEATDFRFKSFSTRNLLPPASERLRRRPGGYQQLAIVRFLKGTIEIHAGDTVEWSNHDPDEPHTITFGTEPPPNEQFPFPPNVTVDSDGALHAVITCAWRKRCIRGSLNGRLEDVSSECLRSYAGGQSHARPRHLHAGRDVQLQVRFA